MFSLKNGKAVKYKFASQHFVGPNIAYLKFKIKYLAVHIITHINWKKPQKDDICLLNAVRLLYAWR
jgi:hypothetical protein